MTEKARKNSLSDQNKFALRDWMAQQQTAGAIYANVVAMTAAAQEAHSFRITTENMRSLQISSGINLVKQKNKAPEIGDLFARLEALEEKVQRIDDVEAGIEVFSRTLKQVDYGLRKLLEEKGVDMNRYSYFREITG